MSTSLASGPELRWAGSGVRRTMQSEPENAEDSDVIVRPPRTMKKMHPGEAHKETENHRIAVPVAKSDITPAWLSAVLHQGNHLSPMVNVIALNELENVGEGRGVCNCSWKIIATFDKPVSPDTPRKFVLKQRNVQFEHAWEPGAMRWTGNKSYTLETKWYSEIRDVLPVPQPKCYWTGVQPCEDLENDLGDFGVLIEWLGDDLKIVDLDVGATLEETIDIVETLAKLHSRFWNCDELLNKEYFFSSREMTDMFTGFGIFHNEALTSSFLDKLQTMAPEGAVSDAWVRSAKYAVAHPEAWLWKSVTSNNRTIGSIDFRINNVVWRRVHNQSKDYECVIIDHQLWYRRLSCGHHHESPIEKASCATTAVCVHEYMDSMRLKFCNSGRYRWLCCYPRYFFHRIFERV
eukprot:m.286815 g.286815  ORF g.286815 m.286815 type:complete len:405 (+) comp19937_c1_seq20:211-1425(+)